MKARIALGIVAALALGQLPLAGASAVSPLDAAMEAARSHLMDHRGDYGVRASDLDELRFNGGHIARHTGTRHLYLRQQVHGLDVMTGDVSIAVQPTGAIAHVGSRLLPNIDSRTTGAQRLGAVDAVRAAAAQLGLVPTTAPMVTGVSNGMMRATLVSPAGISLAAIPARLVYQPSGALLRLGWELEIQELSEQHWWNVVVDAETGGLLDKHDYVIHEPAHFGHAEDAVEGDTHAVDEAIHAGERDGSAEIADGQFEETDGASYNVYAWPLESPNDGARTIVTDVADPDASPYGWHDIDGQAGPEYTKTRGNNVHAYADYTGASNSEAQGELSPDGGGSLTFDHPIDFLLPPVAFREAAITNLFYWNNIIHDVFDGYGFDAQSGNFEENSYGDGIGSDYVFAEAQDGGGVNNANFGTPPEGSNPRMQMYNWAATGKRQLRDGDLDAGVVIHEYGHGISNRLTGGAFNVSCLRNAEQAGEGWSDWFAIALTANEDEAAKRRGLGTYVVGQDARTAGGIRPSAYWTTNPSPRYDSIKTAAVPHGVGWVWSAMLWEMHWALVKDGVAEAGGEKLGFNSDLWADWDTGGNNLAVQLVMDGLKLQVCSPGFVNSRDAIIKADDLLTGVEDDPETEVNETIGSGANRCVIWRAFAKRGLGDGASQGSSASVIDGTQSFALPPGC
jgi:extracellular elastinolytic metalloproteinase